LWQSGDVWQHCCAALLRSNDGPKDGKPEGLAFTAEGRAIVRLDTRKPCRNLILLEPAVTRLRDRGAV
jgi:hypothetical protein